MRIRKHAPHARCTHVRTRENRVGVTDSRLFDTLTGICLSQLQDFKSEELVNLAWAYAQVAHEASHNADLRTHRLTDA